VGGAGRHRHALGRALNPNPGPCFLQGPDRRRRRRIDAGARPYTSPTAMEAAQGEINRWGQQDFWRSCCWWRA